jgi:ketopantoate reductase
MGSGAVGGYTGGWLHHHGHDVTLIDMWPEHIETIRAKGLELDRHDAGRNASPSSRRPCISPRCSASPRNARSTSPSSSVES